MNIKRGYIYRVNLEPTVGSEQQGNARPCVVLSINPLNKNLRQVCVVPLSTSAKASPPIVIPVPSAGIRSVALCHQVRTIDKSRISKEVQEISHTDLLTVEAGVRQVLGL